MKDKINIEYGKTYTPKKDASVSDELTGSYWRAWAEDGKYYYECDTGHFATKLLTVEVCKSDFELFKSGELNCADIERKYFP